MNASASAAFSGDECFGPPYRAPKVAICIPCIGASPFKETASSLALEAPHLKNAGWQHITLQISGCPYISAARAGLLRRALNMDCTAAVFVDHDLSWSAGNLTKLLQTEGGIVGGTYRYKQDGVVKYMGKVELGADKRPVVREADGAVEMRLLPAGFLKVTRAAVNRMVEAYPDLCYGERCNPHLDLFRHGADEYQWWGEDFALSRRWRALGETLWCVPNLDLMHHTKDKGYPGNYHHFLQGHEGAPVTAGNPTPPAIFD